MINHDFIFSNERRYRFLRHVTFWAVWCVTYLLLFHFPIHSFKGWSLNSASESFQDNSVVAFVVKTLVFNTTLATVVPQALFTYLLLYYILPTYFFRKKPFVLTAGVLVTALLAYYVVAFHFKYMTVLGNFLFRGAEFPTYAFMLQTASYSVTREMLIALPIVTGFALMLKLMKRWWLKQKETEQLASEKTKAELQLLKAQVHPHFLFNTLNNIYFFTLSGSPKAPEMIKKLSGLLQYILTECNQPLVPLQKELTLLGDYTALEKIRYGDQMKMTIEIQDDNTGSWIAPLLLIPFVENSFKHGASRMISGSWVKLCIAVEEGMLHFFIINSRPAEAEPHLKKGKIGLKNVKKRLQLLYPDAHELSIVPEPESFAVYLKIRLPPAGAAAITKEDHKTTPAYAMA